ncbi:MAG TPA: hypothetical protein VMJ65_18145 [Solirubrobacteraceae bacterium]|jgi:hypothetical protein|nr:hypothetical protein [Solirubrobacteraceae bacterium]
MIGIPSLGQLVRRVYVAVSVHDCVGFSDGSAFIAMLGQLLVGYGDPQPLFGIAQALVMSVDVFCSPGHARFTRWEVIALLESDLQVGAEHLHYEILVSAHVHGWLVATNRTGIAALT